MTRFLYLIVMLTTFTSVAYATEPPALTSKVASFSASVEDKTIAIRLGDFFAPTLKVYMHNKSVVAPYSNSWFYSLGKVISTLHGSNQTWVVRFSPGKDKQSIFEWVNVTSLSKDQRETWADVKDMEAGYSKAHTNPTRSPQILNTMLHLCVSSKPKTSCDVLKINEEVAALFEFKGEKWVVTHITASPNADVQANFATKIKLSSLFF